MPIVPHDKKIEPPDDSEIWRFMKMDFFRDLMAAGVEKTQLHRGIRRRLGASDIGNRGYMVVVKTMAKPKHSG